MSPIRPQQHNTPPLPQGNVAAMMSVIGRFVAYAKSPYGFAADITSTTGWPDKSSQGMEIWGGQSLPNELQPRITARLWLHTWPIAYNTSTQILIQSRWCNSTHLSSTWAKSIWIRLLRLYTSQKRLTIASNGNAIKMSNDWEEGGGGERGQNETYLWFWLASRAHSLSHYQFSQSIWMELSIIVDCRERYRLVLQTSQINKTKSMEIFKIVTLLHQNIIWNMKQPTII